LWVEPWRLQRKELRGWRSNETSSQLKELRRWRSDETIRSLVETSVHFVN